MKRLLYIFILLSSCGQSAQKSQNIEITDKLSDPILGSYNNKPDPLLGSGINLHPGNIYTYWFRTCISSGIDSGKYTISNDTIYFQSMLKDKSDSSNYGHEQIRPLTGRKFLINDGRIYYWFENGKYDARTFWLREGLETTPSEMLDSNGNGYAWFYNGSRQWTKRGTFIHNRLIDGEIFSYLPNGAIEKIELYENGIKVKDSIPMY